MDDSLQATDVESRAHAMGQPGDSLHHRRYHHQVLYAVPLNVHQCSFGIKPGHDYQMMARK